jgi:hypothetical protein
MGLKELSVELRDRIVLRHRSGEAYQNISVALKVPKNIVASIILKERNLEPPRLFLKLAAKPTNRGRRALVREVTKNPMVTLQSSRVPLWRWENLPEGQPSMQHSTNQAFMVVARRKPLLST